jgi:hypothetical protein
MIGGCGHLRLMALVSARTSERFPYSGKRSSHDSVPERRFLTVRRAICRDITGL